MSSIIGKELMSLLKEEICKLSTLIKKARAIVYVGDDNFIPTVLRSNNRCQEGCFISRNKAGNTSNSINSRYHGGDKMS